MSDALDDERKRIREQKKRELQERLEHGGEETTQAPSEPIEIDGPDHLESVVDRHDAVLVDCYADWCGPCKMLEPTIEALAADTEAAVAKVDIDRHRQLAQRLGARSVPTLVFYADGQQVDRVVGAQDRATLEARLEQLT